LRTTRAKAHAKPAAMARYHAGQWPHFGPGLTVEINPVSSSPRAMARYRDLCGMAIEAQAEA
jgi:hypothetical protein